MRSREEEAPGGRDAVVQRERPDCLACAVFDAEPACEQERHTSLAHASRERICEGRLVLHHIYFYRLYDILYK